MLENIDQLSVTNQEKKHRSASSQKTMTNNKWAARKHLPITNQGAVRNHRPISVRRATKQPENIDQSASSKKTLTTQRAVRNQRAASKHNWSISMQPEIIYQSASGQ